MSQPLLFENVRVLNGLGGVRDYVGRTCARWVSELLDGELMPDLPQLWYNTDVRKRVTRRFESFICPMPHYVNLEVKSSGSSNEFFIYTGRLMKDRIWSSMGNELLYCIWSHRAVFRPPYEQPIIATQLQEKSQAVYFLSLASIKDIAADSEPVKLNSNYGHHDERENCYGSGYRFRFSQFDLPQLPDASINLDGLERSLHVYSESSLSQTIQLLMRRRSQLQTQDASLEAIE